MTTFRKCPHCGQLVAVASDAKRADARIVGNALYSVWSNLPKLRDKDSHGKASDARRRAVLADLDRELAGE